MTPKRWVPFVDEARVETPLAAIVELLQKPPSIYGGRRSDPALAVSMFGRDPGFALFFAYMYLATRRVHWRELAISNIETALEALPLAVAERRPFFGYGVAGLAWVIAHLDGWILDGIELDDVDAMLNELVAADAVMNFGFLKGLVGYGVYAIERCRVPAGRQLLERVVKSLVSRAREVDGGVAWRISYDMGPQQRAAHADGIALRGVLEGAAGAIAVLAAAARLGVTCEGSAEVIERGLRFVWSERPTGCAWAHQDLGVAAVIAATHAKRREDAFTRARLLASDPSRSEEPSLAGGVAGAMLMFQRLHAATGDAVFSEAAQRQCSRLLELFDPARGHGGFRFWQAHDQKELLPELDTGWIVDPGLMGGVAGVGLALLAASTPIEPVWDRCLLLSMAS